MKLMARLGRQTFVVAPMSLNAQFKPHCRVPNDRFIRIATTMKRILLRCQLSGNFRKRRIAAGIASDRLLWAGHVGEAQPPCASLH